MLAFIEISISKTITKKHEYMIVHEEPTFINNVQIKWLIVKFDVELKE